MNELMYGAAYYPEYENFSGMKETLDERIDRDLQMMKEAGMNVVRISESTWSTWEKAEGVFDFSILVKTLDRCEQAGMNVIIGTPTYAIPSWLDRKDRTIIDDTYTEPLPYGARPAQPYGGRQIMDITNPTYRYYGERVIRKMCEITKNYDCVIGYQLDNETKFYNIAGERVRELFKEYLKSKFGTIENVNKAFGFAYWSNSVASFDDLPDVRGTINGSYGNEFDLFRRSIPCDFLKWQRGIVDEYRRREPWTDAAGVRHEAQFITHNIDFGWDVSPDGSDKTAHTYGMQDGVNHYEQCGAFTLMGMDVYHPSQSELTGQEIAFGGDETRSLERAVAARNGAPVSPKLTESGSLAGDFTVGAPESETVPAQQYFVLETEAQGFKEWTAYPGQLRLQALSHLASGALAVEYWHWHSIHNSIETYWKGVLSHDLEENEVYREAKTIGAAFKKLSPYLMGYYKKNRVALIEDNISQTAMKWFPIDNGVTYNNILMQYHKALYELNIECDVLDVAGMRDLAKDGGLDYDVLVVPAMYCASEETIAVLRTFTENGGTLIAGCRSFYADECVKIYSDALPHGLADVFGVQHQQISQAGKTKLCGQPVQHYMELLIAGEDTEVLANYEHPYWSRYAGITKHAFGEGTAWYIGAITDIGVLKEFLKKAVSASLRDVTGTLLGAGITWPLTIRSGFTADGKPVHFFFNYSEEEKTTENPFGAAVDLLTDREYAAGEKVTLSDWGAAVLLEK